MTRRRKRYWAKALRKASALPITFPPKGSSGVSGHPGSGGGLHSIADGVMGVTGHVGSPGGVPCGTGGGAGRAIIGIAGSGVGANCGGPRLAASYLATRPGARSSPKNASTCSAQSAAQSANDLCSCSSRLIG